MKLHISLIKGSRGALGSGISRAEPVCAGLSHARSPRLKHAEKINETQGGSGRIYKSIYTEKAIKAILAGIAYPANGLRRIAD